MYYLNTNTQILLFQEILNSKIYVDKSMLIEKISTQIMTANKYVCITRPRRFGKSVNANMLGAYYTKGYDTSRMFEHLAISEDPDYRKNLNKYNVIHIDFSRLPDLCESYREYITDIIENIKSDLKKAYPNLNDQNYKSVSQMFKDTGDTFIFIMDEWDYVFYRGFMADADKESFLLFLKGLLKDQPYVGLAYMTGVLPIAKYSSGSELNMFVEFNAINDDVYAAYFGMNEDEVKILCNKIKSVSYEELKYWYDGYYTNDGGSIFNPRSVNCALTNGTCRNYWTETGPMNEIADCIEHNVDAVREDIVKMVSGITVSAKLNGYSAVEQRLETRNEILSAMVVYGFLSYFDGQLKIPNHELMEKFEAVLSRESMGDIKQIVDHSREILRTTLACENEKLAQMLEEVHDREVPFLQYNDENSLSCVITLCYLAARDEYRIEREAKSGKGYCDYLFLPKKSEKPAIIIELKVDDTPENAILQIRLRNYIQKIETNREILLVGISYNRKEKKHRCLIEKISLG